jgi:hypothetical protein
VQVHRDVLRLLATPTIATKLIQKVGAEAGFYAQISARFCSGAFARLLKIDEQQTRRMLWG